MAVAKGLSLKTISGLVVGGATAGSAFAFKDHFSFLLSEDSGLDNFSIRELIDKAGLDCGLTEEDEELTEAKSCKVKENGSIGVKKESLTEEAVTYSSNETTSLKVSRSRASGYTKNLKFVVDSGDINLLTKEGSTPTNIPKLEQFETYDIRKIGDRFYLLRRTAANREILKKLGLPAKCTLPDEGDSECSLTPEEIKRVRFKGLTVATSKEVELKISKMEDSTDFPEGYRFAFSFPGDLTIGNRDLKANTPYDFRIKEETGNAISLERAWTDDNAFIKKVGLECTNQNECSISADSKLNVRVGDQIRKGIETISGSGKIKVESEQEGYNRGLKFTIRDGDVSLAGGEGEVITKLEELETYEIKEEKGEYFLTRLMAKEGPIKTSLVLPDGCELPTGESTSVECTPTPDSFKNINFDGKSGESFDGESMKLTIFGGVDKGDFPFGYRFNFETATDATISSTNKIKANIPTDFKIKKTEDGEGRINLSLERGWTPKSLGEKAGLICQSSYEDECSFLEEKLNVMVGEQKAENKTAKSAQAESLEEEGRIIIEKDVEGYNQGFKFTIDTTSFTLTDGSGEDITTLEEYETYEIKKEGEKYYLNRKTTRDEGIKTSLVLPSGCDLPTSSSGSKSCTLSTEEFKNINFKDKGEDASATKTVDLNISKASLDDFPLGYKFTFSSLDEATITTNTNVIEGNTPTDFRIKRVTGDQKTTLSLERAWDKTEFAAMVGLDCTDANGTECSVKAGASGKLNVKKGSEKKEGVTDISNDPASGKIKVEKIGGYNQGLKFTITGGDVSLVGGSGEGSFTKLDEYEIYEITEEDGKYYLTRKLGAESRIMSALSLPERCKLPTDSTGSKTCVVTKDDFKDINFDGKTNVTANGNVNLKVFKEDNKNDYPFGYRFNFSAISSATINTSTGTINVNNNSTDFKIKKTKVSGKESTLSLVKRS